MRFRFACFFIISFICVFALLPFASYAQWVPGGVPIAQGAYDQSQQSITSDGMGGGVIAWTDYRGVRSAIYVQRIDSWGNVMWSANGVFLASSMNSQYGPHVVSDGAGGAVIVWNESIDGTNVDIYAQHIDAAGNTLWGANGKAVTTAAGYQFNIDVVSDGAGGAIVAWRDNRIDTAYDIYAQRIDTNGNMLWTVDGLAVCASTGVQSVLQLAGDGTGGAVITWTDSRSATANIYAQRIDAGGTASWTADGIVVAPTPFVQTRPVIVSDGANGAIISWEDMRGTDRDVYARRVSSLGDTLWQAGGTALCTAASYQQDCKIVSDGAGGAIIAWEDNRGADPNIYSQRIDANGNILWTIDGEAVVTAIDNQQWIGIASDGSGGAIFVWEDTRDVVTWWYNIYAQRIDGGGSTLWTADGVLITPADSDQDTPAITIDGAGGALVVWQDYRSNSGYIDLYAQRIEGSHGKWGFPPPDIYSLDDVPSDQGGNVSISWTASPLDVYNEQIVSHYSIWRAIRRIPGTSPPTDEGALVDLSIIDKDFRGPARRVEHAVSGDYFWEWVGNMDAMYFAGYSFTAPTLFDSTAASSGMHYFQVAAHGQTQYEFWVSAPDSGYSVDNLSPAAPMGLAGDYSYALGKLTLLWKPNTEADLSHYAVYRDVGAGFVPTDLNRIATATDTTVTGLPYPPEQPYYIKLSALDIHGNESVFALLPPESVTTPVMVAGYESAWRDGYVEVTWKMSEASGSPGFVVDRKTGADGIYKTLSFEITLEGLNAGFKDNTVEPGNEYTYRVSAKEDGVQSMLFETAVSIPAFKLALYQNYPNPFKPETLIGFELARMMSVELSVFDATGRKVRTLINGRMRAGVHKVPFRAEGLASGVYFYKLKAGQKVFSKKMVVMR